jgi:hypothetical protein
MSEVVAKFNKEKDFVYSINKNGEVIKGKYNILKDPYTLVTVAIILLGGMYFVQMQQSATNLDNFDKSCTTYQTLKAYWLEKHPDLAPDPREIFKLTIKANGEIVETSP